MQGTYTVQQQRRGYWDRGAGVGETSQDLKQKNNLWLENRSETRFNASLVLCYVIQAKLKGRLDYPKR